MSYCFAVHVGVILFTVIQHHESSVEAKKKALKDLRHQAKDKEMENNLLLQEIEELNVTVNERQHIHEASGQYE